ncbi:right-handed parallel beta-helix repeat-containing protein, partial [Bacillus sp. MM2020_1]|nr:right-handed parallel beta-helix repeat-containing protein [Bacillus sp. MM2020_1]
MSWSQTPFITTLRLNVKNKKNRPSERSTMYSRRHFLRNDDMRKTRRIRQKSILIGIILLVVITLSVIQKYKLTEDKGKLDSNLEKEMVNVLENTTEHKGVYKLNVVKWGIFNDGSHSLETTKGINDALKWAQKKGYNTFYLPAGTYLISKGNSETDPSAKINLVSNMTFLMDEKTVLLKESNGYEIYSILFLDSNVENVTIKGGTLRGDKESHNYSRTGESTDGTHEWGNGITTAGPRNVTIDGVNIENFTGDGIEIGGSVIYGNYITEKDLELGGISDEGEEITQKGKIRSNNNKVTNFREPIYHNPHFQNLMMWIPDGVDGTYDLFYYRKDGSFLKSEKSQRFNSTWGYSHVPKDADYFRVVYNANSIKDVKVNRMTVAITENLTIQNCDIGYNRRQGITVGASDNIKILNNKIHNIAGTAPESGIDIEPGFYPAINTLIKGNEFLNNKIHMVFSYGGNATVEENHFGPNVSDGLGFSINPSYSGATVKNNQFENTNFVTWGNTKFNNNSLISSSANFEGGSDVIVDKVNGLDSRLGFKQTEKNGIIVSNITLKSSKNQKIRGGIEVYGKPIRLKSVTFYGNNEISGEGNNKNVYDDLIFINTPEMKLVPGTYDECSTNNGEFELSMTGKINLTKCNF